PVAPFVIPLLVVLGIYIVGGYADGRAGFRRHHPDLLPARCRARLSTSVR
ncbi:MAG: hypothetical protein IPH41_09465, partial [Sulfuritalea sp.]|nr:hypothetical protein [Sulfuritalea sp.]